MLKLDPQIMLTSQQKLSLLVSFDQNSSLCFDELVVFLDMFVHSFTTSSCCTLMFFLLHPHNFLNPEIGLDLLFEKGHRGYRK